MRIHEETKRYRGHTPDKGLPPAVGRLLLVRANSDRHGETVTPPFLLVVEEEIALPSELLAEAVGVIRCGDLPTLELPCDLPCLTLSELPPLRDGALALLDPERESLILSPDLEALSAYVERSRLLPTRNHVPLGKEGRPLSLIAPLGLDLSAIPMAPQGYLLPLSSAIGEEACFELLCSYADLARRTPLTVCLSARLHTEEEQTACASSIRGIFRAAVFCRLSLLLDGCSERQETATLLSLCHRAFCELSEEAREFNGYIPKGLRLDTPLLALERPLPHGADFLVFDIERIRFLLCGKTASERSEGLNTRLDALLAERMAAAREEVYAELSALPTLDPPWLSSLSGILWK